MVGHTANLLSCVVMKYGESNMAVMAKMVFFSKILTMNYGLLVEVAKILQLQ